MNTYRSRQDAMARRAYKWAQVKFYGAIGAVAVAGLGALVCMNTLTGGRVG